MGPFGIAGPSIVVAFVALVGFLSIYGRFGPGCINLYRRLRNRVGKKTQLTGRHNSIETDVTVDCEAAWSGTTPDVKSEACVEWKRASMCSVETHYSGSTKATCDDWQRINAVVSDQPCSSSALSIEVSDEWESSDDGGPKSPWRSVAFTLAARLPYVNKLTSTADSMSTISVAIYING